MVVGPFRFGLVDQTKAKWSLHLVQMQCGIHSSAARDKKKRWRKMKKNMVKSLDQ